MQHERPERLRAGAQRRAEEPAGAGKVEDERLPVLQDRPRQVGRERGVGGEVVLGDLRGTAVLADRVRDAAGEARARSRRARASSAAARPPVARP